jgi:two-component system, OmpR family, response regulator
MVRATAWDDPQHIPDLFPIMTFKTYLVEDNPVIRENLVGFLEDIADATVVAHASSEAEAVSWLRGHQDRWDMAIVDLFLDEGNGLGVLAACKQRRPHQKVVVLSNYATPEMRARSRAFGADAFFDKSAEIDQLLDYCERLCRD